MPNLCVAIEKGGEGKTVTALSLASYLAIKGYKVLLIDFDAQANATVLLTKGAVSPVSLLDVIERGIPVTDIMVNTDLEGLDLIPANKSLAAIDKMLLMEGGQYTLKDIIEQSALEHSHDLIIIDTPPSLGPFTINALIAASVVVIPVTCSIEGIDGAKHLAETITHLNEGLNPGLSVLGAFVNKYDGRLNIDRGLEHHIEKIFGDALFRTRVRLSSSFKEASALRKTMPLYRRSAIGVQDMMGLCDEIQERLISSGLLRNGAK